MKWKQVKLSEIAEVQVGFAFPSKDFIDADRAGIFLLRGDNLQQGYIRWGDKAKKWDAVEDKKLEKYFLEKNDVVLAMDRPIVSGGLKISKILDQDLPCYLVQRVMRLRGSCDVDTSYIFHLLRSNHFIGYIERITTGANIPHISHKEVVEYSFDLPPLEVRKKIASTLSHYDDLIQTNQQRITLLEEAAQRLYDEWFVKLRFPNYQQVPVVEGVPEGWEKVTFADVCESVGGGTPSTKVNEYWENGDVSWVTPTDITRLSSLILLDTEKKITQKGLKESSTKMLPPDTILMTSRASIGYFGLIDRPVCTNQGFISIIPNTNADRMFILFNLKNRLEEIDGLATGSTFKELSRRVFRAMNITLPTEELRQSFSGFVQPLFEQMRTIAKQNQKLTQARDELLPRLMSGQLNVTKLTLTEVA